LRLLVFCLFEFLQNLLNNVDRDMLYEKGGSLYALENPFVLFFAMCLCLLTCYMLGKFVIARTVAQSCLFAMRFFVYIYDRLSHRLILLKGGNRFV
jgi:hypothetical protein